MTVEHPTPETPHPVRDRRSDWFARVAKLAAYVEEQRRFPAQVDRTEDGWPVGMWVCKQRGRWPALDREQRRALCAVDGFVRQGFTRPFLVGMDEQLLAACLRAQAAGACLRPHATFDGYPVGSWLGHVRRYPAAVPGDHLRRLRDAGIDPFERLGVRETVALGECACANRGRPPALRRNPRP